MSLRTPYPKNKPLNDDFQPGTFDVICGRGKTIFTHEGNQHFRQCIEGNAQRYHQARSKLDKSLIVIDIVDGIRSRSVTGGFVKAVKAKGAATDGRKTWVEIGDTFAREKVGHTLWDVIDGKRPKGPPASSRSSTFTSKSQSIRCICQTIKSAVKLPISSTLTMSPVPQMRQCRRKSSLIIHEDDNDSNNFLSLLTQLNTSRESRFAACRRSSEELSLSLLDDSLAFLDEFDEEPQQQLGYLLGTMNIPGDDTEDGHVLTSSDLKFTQQF